MKNAIEKPSIKAMKEFNIIISLKLAVLFVTIGVTA